jgi:hypothetical protein
MPRSVGSVPHFSLQTNENIDNDHKCPDAALKAAVGPDAENMPSVLSLA